MVILVWFLAVFGILFGVTLLALLVFPSESGERAKVSDTPDSVKGLFG